MALTPEIRTSSAIARTINSRAAPASIDLTGALTRTVYNFPARDINVTMSLVRAPVKNRVDVRITQSVIRIITRGRVNDPKVRAWTFTLDGHDFYVLRLGNRETLIYDTHTEEWYVWGSGLSDLWRAFDGTNWLGAGRATAFGSNVVVGDDGNGSLYILDPDGDRDDHAIEGADNPQSFRREVTGQFVMPGYNVIPCYSVELLGSIGQDSLLTGVTLLTSDDRGASYEDCGTIDVTPGEYSTRLDWMSLGSMSVPGRLFRIRDDGALKRIDSLELKHG